MSIERDQNNISGYEHKHCLYNRVVRVHRLYIYAAAAVWVKAKLIKKYILNIAL